MDKLEELLRHIMYRNPETALQLERAKRQFMHTHKGFEATPNKRDLLQLYHKLLARNQCDRNRHLEQLLATKPMRTRSGVTIISALTKPYTCPGRCVYCPDEPGMPKSYISDEPAAARALALKFDPFEQVRQRIRDLKDNGHPTGKIELIIKGGCWNAYTLNYQYWFILRCFQACNLAEVRIIPRAGDGTGRLRALLKTEQNKNEKAHHRIIGLTLETRPDLIDRNSVETLREQGCTRLELGVQTTDDNVLELVERGHSTVEVKRATRLLRDYGFKVDYHLMPQLPGATPQSDMTMLKSVFDDPDYRPDMIKIYPCVVTRSTGLFSWFTSGRYHPYADQELVRIIKEFKEQVPRYVRISRLIRDIPSHHVLAGNPVNNLRQLIKDEMEAEGRRCRCLRCREIGHVTAAGRTFRDDAPILFTERYEAGGGTEYFMSFENEARDVVFAFCRLRISSPSGLYPAFIRELHTYGRLVLVGQRDERASQHKGLGGELMEEAEKICRRHRIKRLAVIAGVGVRQYYRRLGYRLNKSYMVKKMIRGNS